MFETWLRGFPGVSGGGGSREIHGLFKGGLKTDFEKYYVRFRRIPSKGVPGRFKRLQEASSGSQRRCLREGGK